MGVAVDRLSEYLFADPAASVYAVLDGASVPGLLEKLLVLKPEYECLYRGDLPPDMAEVAPYLVRLEPDSELAAWILGEGWGNHWGIFAIAKADLFAMRQHFRRFLVVHDDKGRSLYFRYYDPRVLRAYLPTCKPDELTALFSGVSGYLLEGEDPRALLRFEAPSGALVQRKEALGGA